MLLLCGVLEKARGCRSLKDPVKELHPIGNRPIFGINLWRDLDVFEHSNSALRFDFLDHVKRSWLTLMTALQKPIALPYSFLESILKLFACRSPA